MKIFLGIVFGIVLLIGMSMYMAIAGDWDDSRAIYNFMSTRGATPVPPSWQKVVGKGI